MIKDIFIKVFILTLMCLGTTTFVPQAWAQGGIKMNASGLWWMMVNDYAGYRSGETAYHFQIDLQSPHATISNWSLKARIASPIYPQGGAKNVGGTPFPADKFKIRFTIDNGVSPTLREINAPMAPIPMAIGTETTLIANSQMPFVFLPNGAYRQVILHYEIIVEGGAYLDLMKNTNQYHHISYDFPILFTLYNAQGVPIATSSAGNKHTIQIPPNLTGSPGPVVPDYSLEIVGEAANGTLNFNSLESYINGVSVVYPDAVKISSKTGFELHVKSQSHQFSNQIGRTLPVNVLRVNVKPGSQSPTSAVYPSVQLSTQPQLVMRSTQTSTHAMMMNLEYSAAGSDQRLIDAEQGKYTTVLIYELIPR